jgi:transposase-like protein
MSEDDGLKAMGQVIQIDEARIRDHLGEMVRGTVEETLNALLDAEADRLCGAGRYERSQGRQDTRAGSYERSLHTVAGEVNLKVPKLRRQTFETAIIERYRRRESSVEEALIEMYLAGISVESIRRRPHADHSDRSQRLSSVGSFLCILMSSIRLSIPKSVNAKIPSSPTP